MKSHLTFGFGGEKKNPYEGKAFALGFLLCVTAGLLTN